VASIINYIYKKPTVEDKVETISVPRKLSRITPECAQLGVQRFRENDNLEIVMTVDASPEKCGGILRLPRHKSLYYYSVNWSEFFYFSKEPSEQQSDKFEMLNALIATLAFKYFIKDREHYYSSILIQTDNSFANLKEGRQHKDPTNLANFREITTEMNWNEIPHRWKQVKIWEDSDMWNANQLSRNSILPPFSQHFYEDYKVKADISNSVRAMCLYMIQNQEYGECYSFCRK
jgi:hypothetical protein